MVAWWSIYASRRYSPSVFGGVLRAVIKIAPFDIPLGAADLTRDLALW